MCDVAASSESGSETWGLSQSTEQPCIFPYEVQVVNDKLCLVCGFEMADGPRNYNICPSCGTEFGLHDENSSIEELRTWWLGTGPTWQSTVIPVPVGWSPIEQLISGVYLNAQPNFTGSIILTANEGVLTGIRDFALVKTSKRKRTRTKRSFFAVGQSAPQRTYAGGNVVFRDVA